MTTIRSPLGAIGAILVALESVAGASLYALKDQPNLQVALVFTMIVVMGVVTAVVLAIVIYFAATNPGLLFNPRDISERVHHDLYASSSRTGPSISHVPPEVVVAPAFDWGEHDDEAPSA